MFLQSEFLAMLTASSEYAMFKSMIAFLTGRAQLLSDQLILHTASGAGYLVSPTPTLLRSLTDNQEISLYIHSFIREDRFELYGFVSQNELSMFQLLLTVSGVGPKMALAILSVAGVPGITRAVAQGEVSFFSAAPRVGKKLAQKIIIELKSKLGSQVDLDLSPKSSNDRDVCDALLSLGYSEDKISSALNSLGEALETQDIAVSIKQILKKLAKS
jgi:Holliday junction DNA helicase RuvA